MGELKMEKIEEKTGVKTENELIEQAPIENTTQEQFPEEHESLNENIDPDFGINEQKEKGSNKSLLMKSIERYKRKGEEIEKKNFIRKILGI